MLRTNPRRFAALAGTACALTIGVSPAFAAGDFSPGAKAQFSADFIAFTNARPEGLAAMAGVCGQMRSSREAYGKQMPKWVSSGETDLCTGIDGLINGSDKAAACKAITKSGKTFEKVNVRSEENLYIYNYIAFTADIEMVLKKHCS